MKSAAKLPTIPPKDAQARYVAEVRHCAGKGSSSEIPYGAADTLFPHLLEFAINSVL